MTDTPPTDPTLEALEDPGTSGFAAYDVTLGRFVGGVHRGKSAKADAGKSDDAKAAKDAGHTVEVREV